MTEKPTVSHEQLGAQITALDKRVAAHEKHMNVTVGRLFEKADEATAAAHANSLQLTKVQSSMESILGGRDMHLARLDKHEVEIAELKLTNSRHDGERGVWAALGRSPIIMALMGAMVGAAMAIWTAVKSVSAHVPVVALAVLVTTALAGAALAKPVTVASVIDGDTFIMRGQWGVLDGRKVQLRLPGTVKVRVLGIDTPETPGHGPKCAGEADRGLSAKAHAGRLLAVGPVTLAEPEHDKYGGRLLARVSVAGADFATLMIAAGHARRYTGEGPKPDWCGVTL